MLTITSSFGLTIDEALQVRASVEGMADGRPLEDFLMPIIRARREEPGDDLVSVLCHAEITDDDGTTARLSDDEIMAFSALLLTAGSGTTWKQMGITLIALLTTPGVLDEIRADRSLLQPAIEESLRWNITDPMFSRWVAEDTTLGGVEIPKGAVVHLVIGAASRDPARWENPDDYDIHRPPKPHMGFGERAAHLPGHARGPRRAAHGRRCAHRPSSEPAARPGRRATEGHRHVRARPE